MMEIASQLDADAALELVSLEPEATERAQ